MTFHHYNEFHLGDLMPHSLFLRRLAKLYTGHEFRFYCHPNYFTELNPIIEDVVNVTLHPIANKPEDAVNVWKNAEGFWERHRHRFRWAEFHLDWFQHHARKMGLACPILSVEDLLFDIPAIERPLPNRDQIPFARVIINNAQPCSGQFRAYDSTDYLDPLIEALAEENRVITTQTSKTGVPCTRDFGLNCVQIGHLAMSADVVIGIVNGPMWPMFNVWASNHVLQWIYLRDNGENMNLMPNEKYAVNLSSAMKVCGEVGIL